jgi:hypothetical protein
MEGAAANAVVAMDNNDGYTTLVATVCSSTKRYTIYIKKGVYKAGELVIVAKDV